jgi:hypothetical protein
LTASISCVQPSSCARYISARRRSREFMPIDDDRRALVIYVADMMRFFAPMFAGLLATAAVLLGPGAAAPAPTRVAVWLQTMDSCESAIGGTRYLLTGSGVSITAITPAASPAVVSSGPCPGQRGNCRTMTAGCATFANVPYPGSYTFRQTALAPGNTSNPYGYAPCNGGSACRWEMGKVTINSAGTIQATVLNVYPNDGAVTYPIASGHGRVAWYAGTAADPVVTHDFGLAPPGYDGQPQCDGDSDADDWSSGSPSSQCGYRPEIGEGSVCNSGKLLFPAPRPNLSYRFPWQCMA